MKRSLGTSASVTFSATSIRTPETPPVSTAIAPIQVGAWCTPTGSRRPLESTAKASSEPSSTR